MSCKAEIPARNNTKSNVEAVFAGLFVISGSKIIRTINRSGGKSSLNILKIYRETISNLNGKMKTLELRL